MLTEDQKRKITEFATTRAKANDRFHDIGHLMSTAVAACRLAEMEGASQDMCWAAAMLHDICKNEQGDHGAKGAKEAEKFLLGIGVDAKSALTISDAIHYHNKEFQGGPIERQILWDADKLQAVTLEAFERRVLPLWQGRLGERDGLEQAGKDYRFYMDRFHTRSGRRLASEDAQAVEWLMDELGIKFDLFR
jgi:HD superfamily phosphodiesterase